MIESYLNSQYNIHFLVSRKEQVSSSEAHPLFRRMGEELGNEYRPRWNFFKMLFDSHGEFVNQWPAAVDPTDQGIAHSIEQNLHSWVF